jgi:uncharacterized protein (TIGR03435 family)
MQRIAIAVVLGSTALFAQGSPTFEVASVRPTSESLLPVSPGARIAGAQARFTAIPLRRYIIWAYQVRTQQILGPDWLNEPRFDVVANMPPGVPVAQLPFMLQALLADRFQMKSHRETRPLPIYALTVAQGGFKIPAAPPLAAEIAKLPEFDVAGRTAGTDLVTDIGRGTSYRMGINHLEATRVTTSLLADWLSDFTDRPVLDETGLAGRYTIALDFDPEDYGALRARLAANSGVTLSPELARMLAEGRPDALARALQKSGLTLEPRTGPVEVVVVDSIAKTPTEN